MGVEVQMDANVEVKPPPLRDDASREGKSIADATAEAHDRESRAEAATHLQNEQHIARQMPPGLGDGDKWVPQGGRVVEGE
jgi:hypothetical protein